jgi:LuxR family maltose regulon positive regulatory protein
VLTGGQDPADVRTGLRKLTQLRDAALATHNTCHLIDIDVLRAIGYQRLGQHEQSSKALDHALALASPGGWIRPFVGAGASMADLLRGLNPRHPEREFIARLLAAFAGLQQTIVRADTIQLPALLTERESEILALLAQRLTNQEIAAELVISVTTVKRHTANIYQKLHVNSRRMAVAKAQAIGQLRPSP